MDTQQSNISQLLKQYVQGKCTLDELRTLSESLSETNSSKIDEDLVKLLVDTSIDKSEYSSILKDSLRSIKLRIEKQEAITKQKVRIIRLKRFAAIAALFIAVSSIIGYLFFHKLNTESPIHFSQSSTKIPVILPGGNKAVLKLADGHLIELSSDQKSIVIGQEIIYEGGLEIISDRELKNDQNKILELSTPEGGTYQIVLSDGTRVWLNANTILKYPQQFGNHERSVELIGEAYFDVVRDNNRPFKVKTNEQMLEVLGTSFNINSYLDNKSVVTTLVEGKVKLFSNSDENTFLDAGQQSILKNRNMQVNNVDVMPFIAWKEGLFYFNDTPFDEAISQISRWYDLDIQYKTKIPKIDLYGQISRNKELSTVLSLLEESGYEFHVEISGVNKKLIISKK